MTVWGCVREIKADCCRAVFGKTVWGWIREVTSVTVWGCVRRSRLTVVVLCSEKLFGVGLGRSRL